MKLAIAKGVVWTGWQMAKVCILGTALAKFGIKLGFAVYKDSLPSLHEFYLDKLNERCQELLAKKQEQP